jgi:uncharacterized LabA/DUF88 family protein
MSELRKTAYVFVDAANVWNIVKSKRQLVDYSKMKEFISNTFDQDICEVFYYESFPEQVTRDYDTSGKQKFFVYLKKALGFNVKKKALKQIRANDGMGVYVVEKGNMDVEITIDAVHNINKYDTAIFFTGDCDFLPLVNYIKSRGKRVYIFSSKGSISSELKTGGDGYFDLVEREGLWGKDLKYRGK